MIVHDDGGSGDLRQCLRRLRLWHEAARNYAAEFTADLVIMHNVRLRQEQRPVSDYNWPQPKATHRFTAASAEYARAKRERYRETTNDTETERKGESQRRKGNRCVCVCVCVREIYKYKNVFNSFYNFETLHSL